MYQEHFLWGTGGQRVGLTTLPSSCIDCLEIWETQTPANLRACYRPVQGLLCLLTDSDYVVYNTKRMHCCVSMATMLKRSCRYVTLYALRISRFPTNINENKRLSLPFPYLVPVPAQILQTGVKCTPTKTVFVFIKLDTGQMNEHTVCILHAVQGFLSSLLHDTVNCDSCMRSVIDELVWNTGGKILTGNSKYLEKNLCRCHFIHHKPTTRLRWDRTRESAMKGRR